MSRRLAEIDIAPFLALLEQKAPRPLSVPEMARILELDQFEMRGIRAALDEEIDRRRLRRIGKTRYQWRRDVDPPRTVRPAKPRAAGAGGARIDGRYQRVRAGYGFVTPMGRATDRLPRDILIPNGEEGAALHGDRVVVEITGRDARRRRTAGRVVEVTAPVHDLIIGVLERAHRGWLVIPDSQLLPPIEIIGGETPGEEAQGQSVLVRLTRPGSATQPHGGDFVRLLGSGDDPEVQFLSIALEYGLRIDFAAEVDAEAAALPIDPAPEDFVGREDLRALPLVTIDGETARDFDDAVCVEKMDAGYRLWVAIADVAHYVRPGSALDREALQRGNSVYFPDRAIPMLPSRLSTELCSLNPDRERLVLVAELDIDRDGGTRDARIYRAVMRSRARLTYTEVAAALADEPVRAEVKELRPHLRLMAELMRILYRRRLRGGSLDLDLPEAMIELSEEGRSVGIRVLERNDAHRLIEEFMLAANQSVARYLRDHDVPLPYRIHEPPEPDDIDELNLFLGPFGFRVEYENDVAPRDVQHLLDKLSGHALARVLSRQVLRALKQARYSTSNAGHFGLGFAVYCHFTSPIRRYPDLLVHRQIGLLLDGEQERAVAALEGIEAASVSSSQTEREAMEAERAMVDLKKAEFMREHLHEPGAATIVAVTPFGFYAEFDAYPVEGLVRVDRLDDYYEYVEAERALYGARKRQRFRLGDRVEVETVEVNLRRRTIDLALRKKLEMRGDANPAKRRKGGAPRKPKR